MRLAIDRSFELNFVEIVVDRSNLAWIAVVCCGWLGFGADEASSVWICSLLHGFDV